MLYKNFQSRFIQSFLLLTVVLLSGCSLIAGLPRDAEPIIPIPSTKIPLVDNPEAAREVSIEFLRVNYPNQSPGHDLTWMGGQVVSNGEVGAIPTHYTTQNWDIQVSMVSVDPDTPIYSVNAYNETIGFRWIGLVNANAHVTETLMVVDTPTPLPITTVNAEPPQATATPRLVIPPKTLTPNSNCDLVGFIKDVTIPDGSTFMAGDSFVKTWRLKNTGTCHWTSDYALVFSSGTHMGSIFEVELPGTIPPGNFVDVSVTLTAPLTPGNYRSYWILRNSTGKLFGIGAGTDKAFFVDINVISENRGSVAGKICFPSEHIPAMTLYLQNTLGPHYEFSISENQTSYQISLPPGTYLAYAWTLNFEIAGGYTHSDHRLKNFEVNVGELTQGIDICDWYGEPGLIPLPNPSKYGTISGTLSFPSERIPPLRIVAFDIYNNTYYWVDTFENQETYQITGLVPGYYTVVAYEREGGLVAGYTEYVKCGLLLSCDENHALVIIYVTPEDFIEEINPIDWYAPSGTFPPDPTD